ncbi:uncharacterized protein LOC121728771 [Aricia agestis]|uniref:uncharacterized protein LOC121728771 n=1 Tax=Aricia agestis TaxID=91739 RepID=UPI001C202CBE|nr:uncharacterized protein LOC121728771 [Aricia agestis]
MNNLVKIERTITVKAFIKGNQITFILEVPLISNDTYDFYKFFSLPMYDEQKNKTYIIIPEYPFIMVKSSKYISLISSCQQISENDQYLCTEKEIVPYVSTTCAEQMMEYSKDTSLCIPRAVQIEDLKLQKLPSSRYIMYSRNKIVISERCGNEINKTPVIGTYIIRIETGCEIIIGKIHLRSEQHALREINYQMMPQLHFPKPKNENFENLPLDIKGVNLDDLKHLSTIIKSQKFSDSDEVQIIKVNSVSVATLILYVIILCFCVSLALYKFRNKLFLVKNRNPQNSENSSDGFELKGGGVMLGSGHPQFRIIT